MKQARFLLLGATRVVSAARGSRSCMIALLSVAGVLVDADVALGQQPGATAASDQEPLGEVIVTAQKRATSLERTPLAITALSGQQLGDERVTTLSDLSSVVPSLRIGNGAGVAQLTIRGIGSSNVNPGGESPVAVNVNEVYISRQTGVLTSLYDIASLEILRGPQGTLYGRNATAGAVNIQTARPSLLEWGGHFAASAGDYSAVNLEAAVGGPVFADKLGIQLAGFVDRHNGYFNNIATRNGVDARDAKGIRATILAKPADELTATIIADYYFEQERAGAAHYFGSDSQINLPAVYPAPPSILFAPGGYLPKSTRDIASGFDPMLRLETYSVTGLIEWNAGPYTVKSITGYRDQEFGTTFSSDGGAAPGIISNGLVVKGEPDHQFSEELQGHYDTDRLHLTSGAYYFNETDTGVGHVLFNTNFSFNNPALNFLGLPAPAAAFYDDFAELSGVIKTEAEAVFGQAEYSIFDGLTLTAGARYSHEHKTLLSDYFLNVPIITTHPVSFNPANSLAGSLQPYALNPPQAAQPASFSSFAPRFGLQYQFDPNTMAYFTYSKGFKAGGFDVSSPASLGAYGPEELESFEAGLKSDLIGDTLRLNVSAFHYNYTDLQVQEIIGLGLFTQNAGSAVSNGGEIEMTYKPVKDWTLSFSGTYLDAHYTNFVGASAAEVLRQYISPLSPNVNFNGKRLNNAPRETALLSAEKRWKVADGGLAVKAELEYSGKYFFTSDNVAPLDQDGYAKVNLFLRYQSDRAWSAMAYVRNLTDKVTKTSASVFPSAVGAPIIGSVSDPRIFGVKLEHQF